MLLFVGKVPLFPMGTWILIFFSFYCALNGEVMTQKMSLEDCCKDGQERGLKGQDCASLPLISESTTCRIAQEQCCATVLEDTSCTNGINMAKDHGICETLLSGNSCETKTARLCCDCCLLGRAAQESGLGCDLGGSVGHQCGLVSRACCVDRDPQASADQSVTLGGQNETYLSDSCRGRCSHRCMGNDTCACFEGYKLKPDSHSCEDINECLLGSHSCQPGESCINREGSYRCQRQASCGAGYELTDNNNCHDINECQSLAVPCPPGQVCVNNVGSYTCQRSSISCGRGYHSNKEGTRCVDVDECQGPGGACEGHGCINLAGTFRCECREGYAYNSLSRTCEDVNECRHYPGRLCAHSCENVPGSYKCNCTAGFQLASDSRNCNDVNECESSPCSQECANVYGSYQCYCRRGYQLSDTVGTTCEDIDECALPTGGHICTYRCHNTPGSFHCTCPSPGYTLATNGRSCLDIDECLVGTHSCSEAESCFNIQGGFRCLVFQCPSNYRRAGEARPWIDRSDTIRCIKSCQPNDINCILDPLHTVSHTVISMPTFRDFTQPEEIVFLRTMLPTHPSPQTGSPTVAFDILEGNDQNYFDVIKRYEQDATIGVVRQVKPIVGPLQVVLKVAMDYIGAVSHRNAVNIHVFVSEFWF